MADQAVQPIRPAATVILIQDVEGAGQFEIFMLRRTSRAAFAGGMYVFPGGRVDGDDHLHSNDRWRTGPTERQATQQTALGAEWRGYWIAGIRETFEEAGLLLAYHDNGEMVGFDESSSDRFEHYRHDVHAGKITLAEICATEKLSLAVDHIHFFNRWITPLGRPRRFDTRFFIAEAPPAQRGQHDDKETVDSVWITPQRALERHAADDFGLMGVTLRQLQTLAEHRTVADVREMLETQEDFPIFRPVLPAGA